MPDTKPKPDDPAEYQRFLDMAREVEADEAEGAMDRAFEKVISTTKKKAETDGGGKSSSNKA